MSGYLSGMASSFTTGALDTQLRGFVGETYSGGMKLDALAGSFVGQGVGYAMTGDASFNLLNMRDLTGGKMQGGLLEMHLGDSGFSMNMGMGGADMSYGTLAGAASGLNAWAVNAELALSSQEEAHKYAVAMRTIASTGAASDSALYADILAGRANIVEDAKKDFGAETTLSKGVRTITLGGDKSILTSDLSLGVLLSHEGYRNGIDDGADGQLDETARAIRGHVGTAAMVEGTYGEGILGGQMSAELAAIKSGDASRIAQAFAGYDSSADYWRVIKGKDGKVLKVLDDGDRNHINYVDEDGRLMRQDAFDGKGLSTLIANSTNGKQSAKEINDIMWKSGLNYSNPDEDSKEPPHWYARNIDGFYMTPEARGRMLDRQAEEALKKKAADEAARKALEVFPSKGLAASIPDISVRGNGTTDTPYLVVMHGLFDQSAKNQDGKYGELSFPTNNGPCLLYSGQIPFILSGQSKDSVVASLKGGIGVGGVEYTGKNWFGESGEMKKAPGELWKNQAAFLKMDKYPAYAELDDKGQSKSFTYKQFLDSGYSMAQVWLSQTHWVFIANVNNAWTVFDSFGGNGNGSSTIGNISNWDKYRTNIDVLLFRPIVWKGGLK